MPLHSPQSDRPGPKRPLLGYIKIGAGVLVVAGLAWLVWEWANSTSAVRREVPQTPMIIPLPPPPPPPPEPEKVPEPEEPEEIVEPEPEPEPTPVEEPLPDDQEPTPADDQAEAMEIDGEAQAGGDAFNIAAGSGRGMAGSGAGRAGNATYGQYLAHNFQRILRENDETRHLTFRLQANLWLNEAGQVTRVELLRSSGDSELDDKVIAALRTAPAMEQRPPASLNLPVHVSLQGRRPS
ncbi:energy transducer TonB [Halopseudomonas pelagia]|uniref:energy transducer TonB family protein n=1 Tax=Halopseudomonas pelagia TaxID=553151 RepID=UPI0030DA08FC|tara:strand:+ start:2602 stop:3315 length:714 start_codon:yes stop_codon:yes gene_type:complete